MPWHEMRMKIPSLPSPTIVAGVLVLVAAHVWLAVALTKNVHRAIFLIILGALFWLYVAASLASRAGVWGKALRLLDRLRRPRPFRWILSHNFLVAAASVLLLGWLVVQAVEGGVKWTRVQCLLAVLVLTAISVVISNRPGNIHWRPVLWGILLQYLLALLILRWPDGRRAFTTVMNNVVRFLDYTSNGTSFTLGLAADPPPVCGMDAPFSFTSLPIVIFFSAICSLLYHLGIVQAVTKATAKILQVTMRTTAAESLNAVASVFMGPTEAVVLMQFSLGSMTDSELLATMSAGFALISGSLFAPYIAYGACPTLLLAANVMSAPAVLTISKLVFPETQRKLNGGDGDHSTVETFNFPPSPHSTALEALSSGAVGAVRVVFAIIVNLIVFLAGIAFADACVHFVGLSLGYSEWSINAIFGYIFFPLAWLLGASDATDSVAKRKELLKVAQLIATKTVLNEWIAYGQMYDMLRNGEIGPRGQLIAIFACCGYSNPSQIGSQVGQMAALCPAKRTKFAELGLRGLVVGSLACFMTAAIAGSITGSDMGCRPPGMNADCVTLA